VDELSSQFDNLAYQLGEQVAGVMVD